MSEKIPSLQQKDLTGLVSNIQHYSLHDGPGIRTTVFFKGCSLRCKWCSNPEDISPKPELAYNQKLCIGIKECGKCLKICTKSALFQDASAVQVHLNWENCDDCGKCVQVCPAQALFLFGKRMTVEQILNEAEQDEVFYAEDGGGITLSGGECLLQPDFAAALLEAAHERGITTSIETAGNVVWPAMAKVLPHVDTVFFDLKLMNPEEHKLWTGADNTQILENFQKACQVFPEKSFIARSPIIPGVNDNEKHVQAVRKFIKLFKNVIDYELLPYHRYGNSKYEYLRRKK